MTTEKKEWALICREIINTTGITPQQHSELIFNTGCSFAEHFSRRFLQKDFVKEQLLQNAAWGFWDWWRLKWQIDDKGLIIYDAFKDCVPYQDMKEDMIGDTLYEKELFYLVNHLI